MNMLLLHNINDIYKHNVEAKSQKKYTLSDCIYTHFKNSLNESML